MGKNKSFQLERQNDGLIYFFDEYGSDENGRIFKRRDANVLILRNRTHGWVVVSDATITGVPWLIPVNQQVEYPPEGDWISRKNTKIYVYSLTYEET